MEQPWPADAGVSSVGGPRGTWARDAVVRASSALVRLAARRVARGLGERASLTAAGRSGVGLPRRSRALGGDPRRYRWAVPERVTRCEIGGVTLGTVAIRR